VVHQQDWPEMAVDVDRGDGFRRSSSALLSHRQSERLQVCALYTLSIHSLYALYTLSIRSLCTHYTHSLYTLYALTTHSAAGLAVVYVTMGVGR
jgi:hypothetical protein